MTPQGEPEWEQWEQALGEFVACHEKFQDARQGGNPASIARAWSAVTAAEARLNEVANAIGPQIESWLQESSSK